MVTLLLKASLVLIVLLAFYKLFLEKESFFGANRLYLVGCLLFAATLPFIELPQLIKHQGIVANLLDSGTITTPVALPETTPALDVREHQPPGTGEKAPENAGSHVQNNLSAAQPNAVSTAESQPNQTLPQNQSANRGVQYWLLVLYLFGVVVLTLKLLAQLGNTVWKIYRTEDKITDEDSVLVNMEGAIDPCSFFRYIFINPASYDYETYEQIIAHERIHVRQWHTLDLLFSEIAVVVLWFNPFVWILRQEVEKNIEYQTDDLMVRSHSGVKESYQLNLVKIATYVHPLSITTNYNQSLIKMRILKMNAKKSNPYGYLKYAFLIPTLFGLSLLINEPARGNDRLMVDLTDASISSAVSAGAYQQFTYEQDTLILQTEKQPGYGLFRGGFGPLGLDSLATDDERRKLIPDDISDPQLGQEYIDFKIWHYRKLVEDQHEYLSDFLEKWYPEKIDTAKLPSNWETTIEVIVGQKNGVQVYIVDQNNNQDFRDDPVRPLKKTKRNVTYTPVPIQYRIYNGQSLVPDSSWMYVARLSTGKVGFSAAQHMRSTFSIADQQYTVQIYNGGAYARWCFEDPKIAITAYNNTQKDTLTFSDKFALGEYLKFGQRFYQFADITNDGSRITLIRDRDIKDNFGIQVGLIAPDFEAVTSNGQSISLRGYRGRYLLLANMDRCRATSKYFEELSATYHSKMAIVGIEYSADDLQHKLERLKLVGTFVISEENPSIRKNYRDFHCSSVCYLIDPGGRIIDRFEMDEWELALAKHFE